MNINKIIQSLNRIDEIKIAGRDFEYNGTEYHFVGFYRNRTDLHAVILSYNKELYERKEKARIDALNSFDLDCTYEPTVRESERMNLMFEEPVLHISKMVSEDIELISHESHCTLLENCVEDNIFLISEFVRAGWKSNRFDFTPLDRLYLNDIMFMGEYTSIPVIGTKTILSFGKKSVRSLAEIPLILEIGTTEKEIELLSGDKIFIREIKLLDMYDEMEQLFSSERFRELCSPEEIEKQRANFIENFSPCCPKGKYYIAVEYEAPENISVDIKLKAVLDAPPIAKSSCMAFIIRSDTKPLREKMAVKTAVIDTPFDSNTRFVEAEIFTVSVINNPDDIII